MNEVRLTNKQIAILKVVVDGNGEVDGKFSPCDLDQIMERVSYHPSKDAIQFSIRKLIDRGLIEKGGVELRRDRHHVLILPTELARSVLQPTLKKESFIESDLELQFIN